jgi:hypothetical protein
MSYDNMPPGMTNDEVQAQKVAIRARLAAGTMWDELTEEEQSIYCLFTDADIEAANAFWNKAVDPAFRNLLHARPITPEIRAKMRGRRRHPGFRK